MNKKVTIYFPFTQGPGNGGNNFLVSLKNEFIKMGIYCETLADAHAIIFNSHHNVQEVLKLKRKYPEKIFIHRVDGPMTIYNGPSDKRDSVVRLLNCQVADGTVFQSNWSMSQNIQLNLFNERKCRVICNAPNPDIFFVKEIRDKKNAQLKIISSGWSNNPNKGGETLCWLDQNLDFNKYDFEFIGPTIINFKNIKKHGSKTSQEIGEILRSCDVFFFPSKYEACSNALLEGIHSGLIPLAKNSSSNIEIIDNDRLLFDEVDSIIPKLDYIFEHYEELLYNVKIIKLDEVAKQYYQFATSFEQPSTVKFSYWNSQIRYWFNIFRNKTGNL
ncbi:MAG: hypothetical protein A2381_01230 [Bdellovibrionales bacterium RIFOXYB1_FULL_37_110]|nr:MAG: hypothetical protein A2417_02085 [Bdellovibrionales bacterium RIFOXYC1_FULL_37_79]OFZ58840.1 MAG: hypothetical protein A2381_01230 [Bdellovibrionales bacterium RIFOXYB1_FULL_37_110]OFZ64839.1 MAG: hypothetical protein A2577_07230 [Bdellovibrionales bacterium RIFOXYD1_FULL_36_51]